MHDDFSHSEEADDVMHLFYGADIMVYVEGQDDIPFWEFMFTKFVDFSVEVQDVGDCKALEPYMNRIKNDKIKAIVACDLDLTIFTGQKYVHNNIIRTPKYSIENTMINEDSLVKAIKTAGKLQQKLIDRDEITNWKSDFLSKTEELVLLETFSAINNSGISVVGDNASRFMESRNSCILCDKKISSRIKESKGKLIGYDKETMKKLFNSNKANVSDFIKGHFLFSAVNSFCNYYIKSKGSKKSISNDYLFSSLILTLDSTFNENHEDFKYYKSVLSKVSI